MWEDDYELDVELSGHVPVFKVLFQYLLYRVRRKQRLSDSTDGLQTRLKPGTS
jgi:hypothetical protein